LNFCVRKIHIMQNYLKISYNSNRTLQEVTKMGRFKKTLQITTYTILSSPLVVMFVQYMHAGPGVGGG